MSDELKLSDELNRPDDLRLPDQLAAIEAQLAAHPLAPAFLNRDELLYRAGWAACEANAQPAASLPAQLPATNGGAIAAWSFASAALAASLAVAATLSIVGRGASRDAVEVGSNPTLAATELPASDEAATPAPLPASRNLVLAEFDVMSLVNRRAPTASLWATVERERRPQWSEPIVSPTAASASAGPRSATAGELLEELLPAAFRRGKPAGSDDALGINLGDETI